MGNQFRTEVKKKTPESSYGTTKKKLVNSYRVSKVRGYGKDLYVEFRSTSPHFPLEEVRESLSTLDISREGITGKPQQCEVVDNKGWFVCEVEFRIYKQFVYCYSKVKLDRFTE